MRERNLPPRLLLINFRRNATAGRTRFTRGFRLIPNASIPSSSFARSFETKGIENVAERSQNRVEMETNAMY